MVSVTFAEQTNNILKSFADEKSDFTNKKDYNQQYENYFQFYIEYLN